MVIKKLQLKNFRNYKEEEVVFSENISLIYGENAQGKTNIVEALYLFATGKSHRTKNINELILYGEGFFDLILFFEENQYDQTLEIRYEKGKGKQLFINDVKKEKMSDLLGVVPSVLFAPESLLSVKGSPGERRRILDIVLCQMSRKYLYDLQKYNKILKNKNILLRELQTGARHQEQLEVWNESQAKAGATVIGERKSIVTSLEKRMNRLLQGISDGRERINLKYKTLEDEDKPLYETLLNAIEKNSGREIEQGSCLIGPHRDDLEIYVNQRNSRVYCSQGQQRSVALAMNIAILEELEDKLGKAPILLLDDVMSELDEKRQRYLFDVIEKRQTIITTTEKSKFEKPGEKMISYIQVKDGKIVESHPG